MLLRSARNDRYFKETTVNADFTAEELAFQAEVREFLANEFPAELKTKVDKRIRLSKEEIVSWQKILHKKGWMAPNWGEHVTNI